MHFPKRLNYVYSQWCMSILVPLMSHQHLVWSLFLILVIVIGIYIYIYKTVFHCGFYLNFSREYWWWASLLCLLAICISLMKCPSSKSFSISKLNSFIVWFFLVLCRYMVCRDFLPVWPAFSFLLSCVFWSTEVLNFAMQSINIFFYES